MGLLKNQSSIRLEDYEESISLTLRTRGETRSKTSYFKSKFACILEASGSTRMRMEESLPKYHEDHIVRKGDTSLQHYNLVHKFFLCLLQ